MFNQNMYRILLLKLTTVITSQLFGFTDRKESSERNISAPETEGK